jgi:ADP-heptose:LPS heptosyltransferase
LFKRSFPEVDIREAGTADSEAVAESDMVAGYETLIDLVGVNELGGIVTLPALKADQKQAATFRSKYLRSKPVIGICWHSTNDKKDLPTLDEWSAFLRRFSATFVSLQYGDAKQDIETLARLSGGEIIYDETVDSLANLDTFAAQISALDAVITISNTGAHMAGALDVPMLVLLDDKDHLMWPFVGRKSDWYPRAKLFRKGGRAWLDVFADVATDLSWLSRPAPDQRGRAR